MAVDRHFGLVPPETESQRGGQFRSKSPGGVVQEIHALALFLAISRHLMALAVADLKAMGFPCPEIGLDYMDQFDPVGRPRPETPSVDPGRP